MTAPRLIDRPSERNELRRHHRNHQRGMRRAILGERGSSNRPPTAQPKNSPHPALDRQRLPASNSARTQVNVVDGLYGPDICGPVRANIDPCEVAVIRVRAGQVACDRRGMTLIPGITIRSATDDDVAAIQLLGDTSFGMRSEPEYAESRAQVFPTEEAIVAIDDGRVVGHARSTRMTLTVPGERTVEACGIAGVGVAPTHRRRGILRAIYTEQHQRTEAAGLPLTIFTASQGAIYGRFGYGPTIRQNAVSIDRRFVEFLPSAPDPGGVVLSTVADAGEQLRAIYDRWRRLVPGAQARPEARWQMDLSDSPAFRDGGTELFVFLHPDGYVLYRYHRREQGKSAVVEEMRAVTPEAQIALWRALFGLELCSHVEAAITDNDPLPYLLTDLRLVRTKARFDDLWLRLMDVPAALTARSYLRDLDVVLAVQDPFRNAGGTFALTVRDGIAECTPTTRPPDFELGIDVLASVYLGAYPARVFAAANRLQAKDAAQLRALDEAFGAEREAVLGWFF